MVVIDGTSLVGVILRSRSLVVPVLVTMIPVVFVSGMTLLGDEIVMTRVSLVSGVVGFSVGVVVVAVLTVD